MFIRRLVLVFSIVVCGSLALAAAALAAGGGGLAPGQYSFADTSANAFFGYGKGGPPEGFSVFVNRGLNTFEPESGGVATVSRSTIVQLSVYTATGYGFGCYVIPETDFVVSSNLQSASLDTTLTTANMCKGFGAPGVSQATVPALVGNAATAPSAGLPPSITVKVTWTGNGVTSTMKGKNSFECLDYSTDGSYTALTAAASAAGTISMLDGSFTAPNNALVGSGSSTLDISGYRSALCPGKG